MMGQIIADQDTSFQAMDRILQADDPDCRRPIPRCQTCMGFTGGGQPRNTARMFVSLKPLEQRKIMQPIS